MKLHRVETADWSNVAPADYNRWQRMADFSHGLITPANAITIIGGILVYLGLFKIGQQQFIFGILLIALGRGADVLDGIVAEATKTKSEFGEGLDVAIDKTVLGLALIILLSAHTLPVIVGVFMAVHAIYNTVVSLTAKHLRFKPHPDRIGKLGTAFEWICVGLYILVAAVESHSRLIVNLTKLAAATSFIVFSVLAILSSVNYGREFYQNVRQR